MSLESVEDMYVLARKVDDVACELGQTRLASFGIKAAVVCGQIEREVKEKYIERSKAIEFPVDADGVPWTPGPTRFVDPTGIERTLTHISYILEDTEFGNGYWAVHSGGRHYLACACRHAKPRTLDSILEYIERQVLITCDPHTKAEAIIKLADQLQRFLDSEEDEDDER